MGKDQFQIIQSIRIICLRVYQFLYIMAYAGKLQEGVIGEKKKHFKAWC